MFGSYKKVNETPQFMSTVVPIGPAKERFDILTRNSFNCEDVKVDVPMGKTQEQTFTSGNSLSAGYVPEFSWAARSWLGVTNTM